jgi:segregation and condensation protein A
MVLGVSAGEPEFEPPAGAEALRLALEGFEGPLDLLLALARAQKVDLLRISILRLAEQYLDFIAAARGLRLELAADWLVMAAWLAWLKSRLLLPPEERPADEPSPEALAEALAGRLSRLALLRSAAARLMARPRLGVDVFARGFVPPTAPLAPKPLPPTLPELLRAYGRVRGRGAAGPQPLAMAAIPGLSIEAAFRRLARMLPRVRDWTALSKFLPRAPADGFEARAAVAATLVAVLELARRGELALEQARPFTEIMINRPPSGVQP